MSIFNFKNFSGGHTPRTPWKRERRGKGCVMAVGWWTPLGLHFRHACELSKTKPPAWIDFIQHLRWWRRAGRNRTSEYCGARRNSDHHDSLARLVPFTIRQQRSVPAYIHDCLLCLYRTLTHAYRTPDSLISQLHCLDVQRTLSSIPFLHADFLRRVYICRFHWSQPPTGSGPELHVQL